MRLVTSGNTDGVQVATHRNFFPALATAIVATKEVGAISVAGSACAKLSAASSREEAREPGRAVLLAGSAACASIWSPGLLALSDLLSLSMLAPEATCSTIGSATASAAPAAIPFAVATPRGSGGIVPCDPSELLIGGSRSVAAAIASMHVSSAR